MLELKECKIELILFPSWHFPLLPLRRSVFKEVCMTSRRMRHTAGELFEAASAYEKYSVVEIVFTFCANIKFMKTIRL